MQVSYPKQIKFIFLTQELMLVANIHLQYLPVSVRYRVQILYFGYRYIQTQMKISCQYLDHQKVLGRIKQFLESKKDPNNNFSRKESFPQQRIYYQVSACQTNLLNLMKKFNKDDIHKMKEESLDAFYKELYNTINFVPQDQDLRTQVAALNLKIIYTHYQIKPLQTVKCTYEKVSKEDFVQLLKLTRQLQLPSKEQIKQLQKQVQKEKKMKKECPVSSKKLQELQDKAWITRQDVNQDDHYRWDVNQDDYQIFLDTFHRCYKPFRIRSHWLYIMQKLI